MLQLPLTDLQREWLGTLEVDTAQGRVFRNGKEICTKNDGGYYLIRMYVNSKQHRDFKRSHIIWWKATGIWPEQMIDHINQDQSNDAISNIRLSNYSQNMLNVDVNPNKASGLPKGVLNAPWNPNKPFLAKIYRHGKQIPLGYHATAEEASVAYETKKRQFIEGNE